MTTSVFAGGCSSWRPGAIGDLHSGAHGYLIVTKTRAYELQHVDDVKDDHLIARRTTRAWMIPGDTEDVAGEQSFPSSDPSAIATKLRWTPRSDGVVGLNLSLSEIRYVQLEDPHTARSMIPVEILGGVLVTFILLVGLSSWSIDH